MTTGTQHPETGATTPVQHTEAAVVASAQRVRPRSVNGTRRFGERGRGKRLAVHVALIAICVLAILPFAWMVSTSLKTLEATLDYPPRWLPSPVQWQNYAE